jgi:DoxX-like family
VVAIGGKMVWVGRVLLGLLSLLLGISAAMKFKGGAEVIEGMAHLGLSASLIVPLGILEISCVVIYLIPATSIVGAILLTGYIGGAILAHLRIGEPIFVQIALGICVWLALYLQENRLRELIPLRTRGAVDLAGSRSTNK